MTPHSDSKVELTSNPAFRRALITSVIVSLAYYITATIGFEFTFQPGSVSTLWMPNSLLLCGLLVTERHWWWLVVLACLPAHLASELLSGVPALMVISWFVSNSAQALLGARLLRYFVGPELSFRRSRDLTAFFVLATFVAPFLASFLDSALVKLNGWGTNSYWDIWRLRLLSNVLASLILVPFVVEWIQQGVTSLRRATLSRTIEAGILIAVLVAIAIVVFNTQYSTLQHVPARLYWPLPFLIWAAIRFGVRGVTTGLLVVMFLAIHGATHGTGPFIGGSSSHNALSIQAFLILISVPLLILAAVIEERQITEASIRQSEERLLQSTRKIRALAAQLITAQESERRRIAMLLHDDVGQNIATLGLAISRLKRRSPGDSEHFVAELDYLGSQVKGLTTQVRQLSHQLHPEVLEHLGLIAALESHIDELDHLESMRVRFSANVDTDPIPPDVAVCLYRVTLEALRNVSLHSGATSAEVALKEADGFLVLEVSDHGRGFDIEKVRRGSGLGLASSEERIRLLSGSLEIQSDPNIGTCLKARVPLLRT